MGDNPIPPGTLALLIMRTIAREGRLHGFEIARLIEQTSGHVFRVEEGSLYPALQRLLIQGYLTGEWGATEENRRARYYRITPTGRRAMESELTRYRRVTLAINGVIGAT